MDGRKYCVYNQTRESFLSLKVALAEEAPERLNAILEDLEARHDAGLWTRGARELSGIEWHTPIDLVYLDPDDRVIHGVESYSTAEQTPSGPEAASALVLPARTIRSTQTQAGDQLLICVAEEMNTRLEKLSTGNSSITSNESGVFSRNTAPTDEGSSRTQHNVANVQPIRSMIQRPDTMNHAEPRDGKFGLLRSWLQNWLSSDRRRSPRQPLPGLVAYYWTGGSPKAYRIGDISSSGLYLLTQERWFPGTMILMTLQRTDSLGRNLDDAIAVQSKVVRWGDDGVGLTFILLKHPERDSRERQVQSWADKRALERFLERLNLTGHEQRMA